VTITSTLQNPPPLGPLSLANLSAVIHGTLTVRRVVDYRGPFNTGRLTPAATNNEVIPFLLTLPTKVLAPAGAPVVIGQHGLTSWRGDMLYTANALAAQGLAMLAIDVIYHGDRVICLKDADCASGVTCDLTANKCVGGAYLTDPTATPVSGTTALRPSPSLPNRDFTNLVNPFAQRDNFRQHTLDLFQLVRIIQDATAGGLKAKLAANAALPAIIPAKIGYLGQSLGSLLGSTFLALSPSVNVGVLNVGGGDLVDIFSDPNSLLSAGAAASLGVTPGTAAYFSLLENLRWITDPAEPLNYARFVRTPDPAQPARTAAKVILQESGLDNIISNRFTQALGVELGLPLDASSHLLGIDQEGTGAAKNVTTFFPTADHSALLNFTIPANTAAIQSQAAVYLKTGLNGTPTVQ
jgi:dienelactone hydrolase